MNLHFRQAKQQDLPALVEMLANDTLGAIREDLSEPLNTAYVAAFNAINADANNELIVVESEQKIVAMLQLTFIPYLTHTGSWRCLVEGVRVHHAHGGQGIGQRMLRWAIARAKEKHCLLVQLTTDKQRPDAIRFYQELGFSASHEGMKLKL